MPTKFFRVATEGATTDGREIQRVWIEQMAKNYKPATYGARVWLEHYRGIMPDGAFAALGDVLALQARTVEDGKLALFAQIEALPNLLAINKAKQKIYTSIEVDPNFAKTGEAYMTGLAVTDTPASLGTEVLKFAATHPEANPFAAKKSTATALFSAAEETAIPIDEPAEGFASAMLEKFSGLIDSLRSMAAPKHTPAQPEAFADKTLEVLGAAHAAIEHQGAALAAASKEQAALQTSFAALQKELQDLKHTLGTQDASATQRHTATGIEGMAKADC